jgi:hypothetical protein
MSFSLLDQRTAARKVTKTTQQRWSIIFNDGDDKLGNRRAGFVRCLNIVPHDRNSFAVAEPL